MAYDSKKCFYLFKKNNFTEKLLLLYIILLPVMVVPHLPLFKGKIQYCDITFLFLFIIWLIQIKKGKRVFQRIPLVLSFIVMLGLFLPSFYHSPKWLQSSIELMGIFYLVCLYFIFYQIINNEAAWWRVVKCWVIISFFISLTGILAYMLLIFYNLPTFLTVQWDYGNLNYHLVNRLKSVFQHPAMLATYLHTSIVFAFILAGNSKNQIKNKWWIYATIIFCIIAAIFTKTRIIAGILMTIFLIMNSLKNSNMLVTFVKYLTFLLFVMITVFVFFVTKWEVLPVKFNINKENQNAYIEFNLAQPEYHLLHKKAFHIIREHPLLGVGLGMYNYTPWHISREEAKDFYRIYGPDITEKDKTIYSVDADPHSTYFGWAAETGLFGLLGILFIFSQVLFTIYRNSRTTTDRNKQFIHQCILAGILGFLLNGWYMDILTIRHFWILFAMGLVLVKFNKPILQERYP